MPVVDLLEPVDVEEHGEHRLAIALGHADQLGDALLDAQAVQRPGQAIPGGEDLDLVGQLGQPSTLRSRSHSRVIPSATAATEAITQSVASAGGHCREMSTQPRNMGTAAVVVGAQARIRGPKATTMSST